MFRLVLVFIFAVATPSYGRNINISSRSFEERIMGGESTTIEKYPYQISLEDENMHICGGSLIKPNVVLTAAHCVEFWSNYYSVRAGSSIIEEGGQVARVTDVCSHSKYDLITSDYDVSVLKLDKSLHLNSAVQLINLQNVGEKVQTNTMATVTGWGVLESSEELSDILQKVEVPKVDEMKCQEIFMDDDYTDRMTCYGYINGEKDACEADSGGPLVANGKQIGIVSWGSSCRKPSFPGVYTRLENKEIHQHINECLEKFAKN